jgi:putative phosphoesterase
MLIGVISDTHIPERAQKIPEIVFEVFKDVDMILHAGDLVSIDVLKQLQDVAPTHCVRGNMDKYYGRDLPENEIINLHGHRIGLNHGEVYPRGDTQQLKYTALELDVDILITGHTHWAFIKELNEVLLLNPGSPTVPRMSDPSVMLLEIDDSKVESQIIKIGNPICKSLNFKGLGVK